MNLSTAAKRLAIKSPVVVKTILESAGVAAEKTGRDLFIDDLAFNEAFGLVSGADEMLSLADAATELGISTASARNKLCSEGGVAVKIGGSWRVRRSDLAAMLPQKEEAAAEEPEVAEVAADTAEPEPCCCECQDEPAEQEAAPSEPACSAGPEGTFVPNLNIPTGMNFSKALFTKISSDLEASQAMVASLSLRLAEAVAAWQADCEAIFGTEDEQAE